MMTILERSARIAFAIAVAIASVVAVAESDLIEADARREALDFMSAAEARYDCKFEEHSMKKLGNADNSRYLLRLETKGDECDIAMLYLTDLAARKDKLIFRSTDNVGTPDENLNAGASDDEQIIVDRLFVPKGQELIHEVNPEVEEN